MDNRDQVCKDREYWDKRFNLASWLFFFGAVYCIFTNNSAKSLFLALIASFGFRAFNTLMDIRHIQWHIDNQRGLPK